MLTILVLFFFFLLSNILLEHHLIDQLSSAARYFASKLWYGETWFMQTDAHMTFAQDWDAISIQGLQAAPSKKPVRGLLFLFCLFAMYLWALYSFSCLLACLLADFPQLTCSIVLTDP